MGSQGWHVGFSERGPSQCQSTLVGRREISLKSYSYFHNNSERLDLLVVAAAGVLFFPPSPWTQPTKENQASHHQAIMVNHPVFLGSIVDLLLFS